MQAPSVSSPSPSLKDHGRGKRHELRAHPNPFCLSPSPSLTLLVLVLHCKSINQTTAIHPFFFFLFFPCNHPHLPSKKTCGYLWNALQSFPQYLLSVVNQQHMTLKTALDKYIQVLLKSRAGWVPAGATFSPQHKVGKGIYLTATRSQLTKTRCTREIHPWSSLQG